MALIDVSLIVLATSARAGAKSFLSPCVPSPVPYDLFHIAGGSGGMVGDGSARQLSDTPPGQARPRQAGQDHLTERCRIRSATTSATAPLMAFAATRSAAATDRNHGLRNYSTRNRLHIVRPADPKSGKAGKDGIAIGGGTIERMGENTVLR
jgi:cytochrome c-type biogenesis protein